MEKRYLAIDLGTKRIGLAMSDPLNIIASAFETILWKGKKALANDLNALISEYHIGTLIFGLPVTLSGNDSQKTKEIRALVTFLESQFPEDIRIEFEDEALTSREAEHILRQMGKNPHKHRERIDQIAAQRILQRYMGID